MRESSSQHIRSMTGFGRAANPPKKGGWSVEIRSLNHRYFEFSLKAPPSLYGLEDRIRELCQARLKRGKVMVSVSEANGSDLDGLSLDEKVLHFYVGSIRKIQRRFGLKGSISVSDLLNLPRIFSMEKKAEAPEKFWNSLRPSLEQALQLVTRSRIREGKVLAKDLLDRITRIGKNLDFIERRTKKLPQEYFEKLRARLKTIFENKAPEDARLWQETALLAERADVTEEIVRLRSHLRLFRDKMLREEAGKELDFILQEMNREANTIGSKAQDFDVSKEVIAIKAELEKIREQVQNIE